MLCRVCQGINSLSHLVTLWFNFWPQISLCSEFVQRQDPQMWFWWWSEGKCLVPHCLLQFFSKVSKHYPPSHHAAVNWDCLKRFSGYGIIYRVWRVIMPQMHFELKLLIFLYIHLLSIWFSVSVRISCRLQFFLQAIYLLSVNWSSLVSQASQETISLLFLLCLPFLLLTLNVHSAPELHNCPLLIHCTFCLFFHQPCSLVFGPSSSSEGKTCSSARREECFCAAETRADKAHLLAEHCRPFFGKTYR